MTIAAPTRGGRGAKARILWAAGTLFYEKGINATGMERLTELAHVSKRTFYQHFPSKDALVLAYLERFTGAEPPWRERALDREDLTPTARLLALFDPPSDDSAPRGCPFHNAAVELPDPDSPTRAVITEHKRAFTARIAAVAESAGAADPPALAAQLAVLFEGALALSSTLADPAPFEPARAAAELLIAAHTGR